MKITDVRAKLLVFPLPAVFMPAWARGRPMRELTMVLVEVDTDEGITGLGAAHAGAEAVIAVERLCVRICWGRTPWPLKC
jgi:L-alanine-DL-glutamate epimerase-like enolase superfamily enzyme